VPDIIHAHFNRGLCVIGTWEQYEELRLLCGKPANVAHMPEELEALFSCE
jgi:hypothetical protein